MKKTIISIGFIVLLGAPLAAQTTATPASCERRHTVPLIGASAEHENWLAGGAMMLGWRKNYSYRISDVVGFLPEQLQEYARRNEALPVAQTDVYLNNLGMRAMVPENGGFTQAQICDILDRHGPIWVFGFRNQLMGVSYIICGMNTLGGTSFFDVISITQPCIRLQVPFSNLASRQRIRGYAAIFPGQ